MDGRMRKIRKRWIGMLGIVAGSAVAAWALIELGVDVDWYRPKLEATIEQVTGMPARVGALDFSLLPAPQFTAYDIAVGEGDFRAQAPQLTLWPRIRPLLTGDVTITSVEVHHPTLHIPQDFRDAKQRLQALVDHINQRPRKASRRETAINTLTIDDATVMQGDASRVLRGDVTVRDVLADRVQADFAVDAPLAGPDATAEGSVEIDRSRGGTRNFAGRVRVAGVRADSFTDSEAVAGATLGGVVDLEAEGFSRIAFEAAIETRIPKYPMLSDRATLRGAWDDGEFRVDEGQWQSEGLDASFNAQWTSENGIQVRASEAQLTARGLESLLENRGSESLRLTTRGEVAARANDLLITAQAGAMYVNQGTVIVPGFAITRNRQRIADSVEATISIRDNTMELAPLKVDAFTLTGEVIPNLANGDVRFDLKGDGTLNSAVLALLPAADAIRDIGGSLTVNTVAGTYTGDGVPNDLAINATLVDGAVTLAREDFSESFTKIRGKIEATATTLDAAIEGASESLGAVSLEASYDLDDRTVTGVAKLPLQNAPALLTNKLDAPSAIGAALSSYGDSTIAYSIAVPQGGATIDIAVDRKGDQPLKAALQLVRANDAARLGDMDLAASFPADGLAGIVPDALTLTGPVDLTFRRSDKTAQFAADVDLTQATIRAGDLLRKPAGETATVEVSGDAGDHWEANTLLATVLDQELRAAYVDGGFVFDDLDIELAAIAPLVSIPALSEQAEENAAGGRVTGRINTAGPEVALRFDEVRFPITQDLGISRLDGTLAYSRGALALRDVAWDGLNSRFVLAARQEGPDWVGELKGEQLDINAFLDAFRELFPPEEPDTDEKREETAEEIADQPWVEGELHVALERVLFEEVAVEQARARVVIDDNDVLVRDLVFVPEEGEVRGRVDILHALGKGRATYDIDVALERVPSELAESVSEGPPRGVEGPVSGEVDLTLPEGDAQEALADAEGTIHLTGAQGTFGKMGLATKVLGVLKTTGIFSLRAPFSKRGGLFYRDFATTLDFDDGLMKIEHGEINASSYNITAKGTVDFEALDSDVRVNVDVLEGVTGLAEKVPLVGQAVGLATKPFDIRLLVTGSPFDMKVRQNLGQGARKRGAKEPPASIAQRDEPTAEPDAETEATDQAPRKSTREHRTSRRG